MVSKDGFKEVLALGTRSGWGLTGAAHTLPPPTLSQVSGSWDSVAEVRNPCPSLGTHVAQETRSWAGGAQLQGMLGVRVIWRQGNLVWPEREAGGLHRYLLLLKDLTWLVYMMFKEKDCGTQCEGLRTPETPPGGIR